MVLHAQHFFGESGQLYPAVMPYNMYYSLTYLKPGQKALEAYAEHLKTLTFFQNPMLFQYDHLA